MGEKAICQRGYAKINLALDVRGLREDGYHEVAMIMQTVKLWDEVTAERVDPAEAGPDCPPITVECNLPYVPRDERNLAWKAAALFRERTGITEPMRLRIYKKIPVSAGLAGGSADAAAALKAMNLLFGTHLPMQKLIELGAEIGSDVPFCLIGGTCLATGRGEIVERIRPLPEATVVLVKPDFGISTPWAYQQFEEDKATRRPDLPAMQKAIAQRDWDGIAAQMINLLEPPVLKEHPILNHIKNDLLDKGATAVLMSGSGPTVYGIFAEEKSSSKAYKFMKKYYGSRYTVLERELYQPGGRRPAP